MFAWCDLLQGTHFSNMGHTHFNSCDPLWYGTGASEHALQRWTGGKAMSGTCAMHSGVVGLHAGGDGGLTHYGGQVVKLLINISSHHLACLICRQVLACQYSQSEDEVSL